MTALLNRTAAPKMSRRRFAQLMFAAGALALVEESTLAKAFAETRRSIPWLSSQTASAEGIWRNLRVEGEIPRALNGTLFRTAPGQTENHGTALRHLFDGDAFLSKWQFENGAAQVQARFLNTPQRVEEIASDKMLYGEYGTPAPQRAANIAAPKFGGKNQPSVNIIRWQNKLLGLSEGGLPTVINPDTLAYEGSFDFGASLPKNITFTAHPRFCPVTGDGYAWGFEKSATGTLHVFRLNSQTGKAETLYTAEQTGFYMAHDAMLTENYFLIVIPPIKYDLAALVTGRAAVIGDALRYYENEPAQLLVFPRDNRGGAAGVVSIEMPSHLVFHHGNAREIGGGKIAFESIIGNDKRLLELLATFKTDKIVAAEPMQLRQITVDVTKKAVIGSALIGGDVEFPRYDNRLTGQSANLLFATERNYQENAALICCNLQKNSSRKIYAGAGRTFGEPVFVPDTKQIGKEAGWLLTQGYDASRNETFLEIRDAQTLDFAARVWANGQHFPLGFHGNFYQS